MVGADRSPLSSHVGTPAPAACYSAPPRQPGASLSDDRQLTQAKMGKSRARSRGGSENAKPAGRRRGKDVSNSVRLLASVEGESTYLGRVRGANSGRWKAL